MCKCQSNQEYDNFLFKKKGGAEKRKSQRLARRKLKGNKPRLNLNQELERSGGLNGIFSSVGNLVGAFKKGGTPPDPYATDIAFGQNELQPETGKEIPKEIWIIGGIVLLLVGGVVIKKISSNKAIPQANLATK